MDEWQFSQPYSEWHSAGMLTYFSVTVCSLLRQPPRVGSAPASGVLPSFGFPSTYTLSIPTLSIRPCTHVAPSPTNSGFSSIVATPSINLTDFGHLTPLLLPDSFPGASQPIFHSNFSLPASWDAAPFSWPAQFSQQPSTTPQYSHTGVICFQPVPARPPSMCSGAEDFYDGYGIDLLMAVKNTQAQDFRPLHPPAFLMTTRVVIQQFTSGRKRVQADLSSTAPASSNKRQKKYEDLLGGWVMQDPDTGEKLTGHEWVKCYPEEFAQHYKKDHRRYIEYLAQAEVDS
ncbi:hypothetical protein K438DRAFT_1986924 [Mycena galopus ATCC 62051]|nr:hypothetical protein K438DRAFT_1986924 [Mycena galopus ATCC 62051]